MTGKKETQKKGNKDIQVIRAARLKIEEAAQTLYDFQTEDDNEMSFFDDGRLSAMRSILDAVVKVLLTIESEIYARC